MCDAPFRVERSVRTLGTDEARHTSYAIARTGEGEICWTDDVTLAYRVVELLNEDVHNADVHR
jgi:hypothetical protein